MTLIIGFKCKEGIGLVADTKITDLETGEALYESKLLTPLKNTPFIVGTAGYTNLASEFTRKIPEIVAKRIACIRILNIQELMRTGLTRDEAIKYAQTRERSVTTNLQLVQHTEKIEHKSDATELTDIELPHIYSELNFIDDCKTLSKKVNTQYENITEPLETLIGIRRPSDGILHLHHIDAEGVEEEINDYFAIGAGYPFVKTFFSQVYDYSKDFGELITQAFRTIMYVTHVAKESSVGYSQKNPPEAGIIFNNGRYGKMSFENEQIVIEELENEMDNFVSQIKNNKISKLKFKIDLV